MRPQNLVITFLQYSLLCLLILTMQQAKGQDTCIINSDCLNAIDLGVQNTDELFMQYSGCNLYSSPDTLIEDCLMGDYPTVWYTFATDQVARVLSVVIESNDFEMPVISLFKSTSGGCEGLEPLLLNNSNLSCVIGSHGKAKALGTPVEPSTTYYLAVSSYLSIGGDFTIQIRALSLGFLCVTDRSMEVREREEDGPLEGPFHPNEKVRVCLQVNEFTGANSGCQWFQGVVPVFGNGWDPSSFDANGQPLNASVNGEPIGIPGNGIYGSSQWDWFDNVDYHYNNAGITIADFDNNGRLDMCNSLFDPDCPAIGIQGACCNPCWDATSGSILPPGWFAYGINGSCVIPGPPISVDWGDGNSCGGGMGPWEFCFDLVTRDVPDCGEDSTKRDLSIALFTFADGETGAWTGDGSICANDVPVKLSLESTCGRISTAPIEYLPPHESGDTLFYTIEDPDIVRWEWNISPFRSVPYFQNTGDNGFTIAAPLVNTTGSTIDVTGIFIGYYDDGFSPSHDRLVKKIKFKLNSDVVNAIPSYDSGNTKIKVYPVPATDRANLEWSFELNAAATLSIYNSQGNLVEQSNIYPVGGNTHSFETHDLLPGIYYIHFGNHDFQYVTKMVRL